MPWLDPSQDEVAYFHPAFEAVGNDVLTQLGLAGSHHWLHHPPSASNSTVPDFALVDSATSEWVLIVEIKRTQGAVFSGRFQAQAKGYAENNQQRFRVGRPVYFAISNLEVTVLFALNGVRPASESVVSGGVITSGSFATDAMTAHRAAFAGDLSAMVTRAINSTTETFEYVWPPIVDDWLQHARALAQLAPPGPPDPTTAGWPEVSAYFGQPSTDSAARVTLLQAFMAAFMRGRLTAASHARATSVPPVTSRDLTARAIDALRAIDFDAVFDPQAGQRFRSPPVAIRASLDQYVAALAALTPSLSELAEVRQDYPELIEETLLAIYPLQAQSGAGKVQTDPELADVLATLAIPAPAPVIDPCCGDGPLLVAAHDRLGRLGIAAPQGLGLVKGIEADPVASRLAGARLALRATSALSSTAQPAVTYGDMFAAAPDLAASSVVLMNPPFRRYEDQGSNPLPAPLLDHYKAAIEGPTGPPPQTLDGQANLFHYYVEYVTRKIQPGTRIGFILDNKWFHNATGRSLRAFVKQHYEIDALVEYPHGAFFASWDIATSLLIAVRNATPAAAHDVRFVRALSDPRAADLGVLASAMHSGGQWPPDWREQSIPQSSLDAGEGWKRYFASPLSVDLTAIGLVPLPSLFARSRRGALQKEGGGTHVFAFPYTMNRFPGRRTTGNGRPFHTAEVGPLTAAENTALQQAAQAVPRRFRGFGLRNSDTLESFEITRPQVERDQTLEPPRLRARPALFSTARRSDWTGDHTAAILEIRNDPLAAAYLDAVEQIVNLTSSVLPDSERFVDLREPYAGELIIPRKMRSGHRVHVNPFAFGGSSRQLRISTNFVSYGGCTATDASVDQATATRLIAAFLVSSFGQLQFEQIGVNREGLLAMEKAGMDRLLVLDPRDIDGPRRQQILAAFATLPFPVPTNVPAASQARATIDRLFAEVLVPRCNLTTDGLLLEVHDAVDEWIVARQP